eukprot:snap_masked-scaffold_45-processed-gene-0.43-mRNA-1 protein AED:1.00 eAED:1.00 QI:0/-1/0/0/-1/1/1/0/319
MELKIEAKVITYIGALPDPRDRYSSTWVDLDMDFIILPGKSVYNETEFEQSLSTVLLDNDIKHSDLIKLNNMKVLRKKFRLFYTNETGMEVGTTKDGKREKYVDKDSKKVAEGYENIINSLKNNFDIKKYSLKVSNFFQSGDLMEYFEVSNISSFEFEEHDFDALFLQREYRAYYRLIKLRPMEEVFNSSTKWKFETSEIYVFPTLDMHRIFRDSRNYSRLSIQKLRISIGSKIEHNEDKFYVFTLLAVKEYLKYHEETEFSIYIDDNLSQHLGLVWGLVSCAYFAKEAGRKVSFELGRNKALKSSCILKSYLYNNLLG